MAKATAAAKVKKGPGSITVKNIPRDLYDNFSIKNRLKNSKDGTEVSLCDRLIELMEHWTKH